MKRGSSRRRLVAEGGCRLRILLALLLLSGPLPGPASAQERPGVPGGASRSDVYRRPLGNDPSTLDPARIRDVYSLYVSQQVFDGLVQFDQTLAVSPALAQFWKASRDGLVWTFHLRKGVRFHHGRELTADDVIFSLTRLLDPKLQSGAADLLASIRGAPEFRESKARSIAGLTVLDRYTVQVALAEASVPFVSVLATGHAKIVPKDIVEARGEGFGTQPVGTGPFRFERWERGKEIVLAANPDYFDGSPSLARVVYRIFPGELSDLICQEFEQGHLEESPVSPACRARPGEGRYQHFRRPTFSLRFYGFNTRMRPLDDRRVRWAFAHAIDRDGMLRDIFLGRHHPARGIVPPGTPGHNPRVAAIPYDVERARELLKEAGYPEGRGLPKIGIWSSVKGERIERELAVVTKQLASVGVQAEPHYETSWPTFFKQVLEGKFAMFVLAWYADVPDPDNFLHKLFHSRSQRNFTGYASPQVDDLLTRARQERDAQKRVDLYRQAERIILDDAPILPVWHYTYERLFQPYVRSVEVNGLGDPYIPLRKIWLEGRR